MIKSSPNEFMFLMLEKIIMSLLCLPRSNARMVNFSKVNLTKMKQWNKLSTQVINGLLHAKDLIRDEYCYKVSMTSYLLNKMNVSIQHIYDSSST